MLFGLFIAEYKEIGLDSLLFLQYLPNDRRKATLREGGGERYLEREGEREREKYGYARIDTFRCVAMC